MPSTSTSMSAQRCFTAWNDPIGRPNCTRSFAYSTAISSARAAPPSISSAVAVAPRSSSAVTSVGAAEVPSRSVVEIEPRDRSGEVHRRLGGRAADRVEVDREQCGPVVGRGHHEREVARRTRTAPGRAGR